MLAKSMMRPKGLIFCALAVVLALPACVRPEDRVTFGGYYFRTQAKPVERKRTLADFTVQIRDVAKSLDNARLAGGYEGTRYCIKKFGTSRIKWAVGPETDPKALRIENGRMTFRGTCDPQ